MDFKAEKEQVLSRIDKSHIGAIDAKILPVVELINSMDEYYTTSSCSGRIFIMEIAGSNRKDLSKWLFVKHDYITLQEVKDSLNDISTEDVWLIQESMILHIACKDISCASKMLLLLKSSGLKRVGIISVSKKIIIEAFGSARLDTIIARDTKQVVTESYLELLTNEANKKLKENFKKIKKLVELLSAK